MSTRTKFLLTLSFLVLAGAGCISFRGGESATDGGVWKSVNRGEDWVQKTAFPSPKGVGSVSNVNVLGFAFDPQDHLAVYARASDDGLLFSYDGGEGWQSARAISAGRVNSAAVSSKDKCTIYAALGPRVWKSEDCNRSYSDVYFETRGIAMTQVVLDWFNPVVVYAANESGDFSKSADAGKSWTVLRRFENPVERVVISPHDSRLIYVGTRDRGVWRSADSGANWTDLSAGFKDIGGAGGLSELIAHPADPGLLFAITNYGLVRSRDAGAVWEALLLPTPPGSVKIHSLASNPKNSNEIYYATATTLYRSFDGGGRWITDKLPTSRAATALAVDPEDPNVIYMGVTKFKK